MSLDFKPFPKIARLSREIIVTEKLDGTNAQVNIEQVLDDDRLEVCAADPTVLFIAKRNAYEHWVLRAGSRTKWIMPNANGEQLDNYGFARWAYDNAGELMKLGPGAHFGEWWGQGIQRRYGLQEKRFSLFNVHRWSEYVNRPACCDVVPKIVRGNFTTETVEYAMNQLRVGGSRAAPGFMNPEGIVIFHTASGELFKKTMHKDEVPKALAA